MSLHKGVLDPRVYGCGLIFYLNYFLVFADACKEFNRKSVLVQVIAVH